MKNISIFIISLMFLASCGTEKTPINIDSTSGTWVSETPETFQVEIEVPASPEKAVETFYRYLNEKKYKEAYAIWDDAGKASGYSYENFEKWYSSLEKSQYTITGDITLKNNLGIASAEIPIEVTLTKKGGKTVSYTGSYTAIQSETGSGSSDEQPYWLLYSSSLQAQ